EAPVLTSATIHIEPSGPAALARTVSTPSGRDETPLRPSTQNPPPEPATGWPSGSNFSTSWAPLPPAPCTTWIESRASAGVKLIVSSETPATVSPQRAGPAGRVIVLSPALTVRGSASII